MSNYITDFPRQKVPAAQKNKKWAMKCALAAAAPIFNNNSIIRKSIKNKMTNYNLRANIIDLTDVEKICNPHKLTDDTFPDTFRHIGRGNAYINLLIGEKLKRPFNFKVFLSAKDVDGISRKEKELKGQVLQRVQEMVTKPGLSEEEAQEELSRLEQYSKFEYQDLQEAISTKILKREVQRQDLKYKLTQCWEDALIAGEEGMYIDVVGRDLVVEKVNPLRFYTLGSGYSEKIEDADIIVWFDYKSVGQVIDRYYEELKAEEIDELENNGAITTTSKNPYTLIDNTLIAAATTNVPSVTIVPANPTINNRAVVDSDGNILVTHINWRSRKKIGELKYFDPLDGSEQSMIVPEGYPINTDAGESVKWYWVNEWWKATLIKNEYLVNWGPIEFQGNSPYQLSTGNPNFVGRLFNVNQGEVHALMDVIKPLDYSYDIAYWKREQEISAHFGSVTFYNASMVPAGWDPEKWLTYALKKKLAPLDPTQEILKGPSRGKSAGVFNTLTATTIQSQAYNDIKMYTEIMMSLEDQMAKITGITRQREAQVSASETATATQVAFQQSSAITEMLFYKQAAFEKQVLTLLLEKAKFLYHKYPQAGQFVFDEMGTEIIKDFDGFGSSYMDVYVENSGKEMELYDSLKRVAEASVQSGQATLEDLVSIHLGESTQALVKKLKTSSERIAKQQQEAQAQQIKAAAEEAERERVYKEYKDKQEFALKTRELDIKEMLAMRQIEDADSKGIDDAVQKELKQMEIDSKERLQEAKLKAEATQKEKDRASAKELERIKASSKPKATK